MEKGQALSAGSEPEGIEVTWQEATWQATIQDAGKANPAAKEKVGVEVSLVRQRRRLTKVADIVLARKGGSAGEVVPARDWAFQREEEREAGEDASAQERPRAGEETEEVLAELPLVVVPFKQSAGGKRSMQKSQPA